MRIIFAILFSFCAMFARAAVPTFQSFEPTQFDTNNFRVAYKAVWTNDAGVVYEALPNSLTLITNLNSYGTFSLPSKVTLLALGTNYLDLSTNSTWLLNSPTNDATQVILSLSAGQYQGQLAFITSQNGSNSFTLPDLSEQWDVPGAYVDIQGDWIGTTNRGIILQYVAPDWVEMARFDPGSTNGAFGITINPTNNFIPYRVNATTFEDSPLSRINASTVGLLSGGVAGQFGVGSGLTFLSSSTAIEWIAGSGVLIMNGAQYFAPSSGTVGMMLGFNTNYFGGLIIGTNGLFGVYTDDGAQLLRNGVPIGGGGGGTTINPTDGVMPYRVNATTFGNGPIIVGLVTNMFPRGQVFGLDGSESAPTYSFTNANGVGYFLDGTGASGFSEGGIQIVRMTLSALDIKTNMFIGWSSAPGTATSTLRILRSAGPPEGVETGDPGSLALDYVNGDIYKKSTGTGNTGWTALGSGSGSALWASAGGVLSPSPAVDGVGIVSQLSASSNSTVLYISSAQQLQGGKLISIQSTNVDLAPYSTNALTVGVSYNSSWNDNGFFVALGTEMDVATLAANTNNNTYNIGPYAGQFQKLTNTSFVINIGDEAGGNQTIGPIAGDPANTSSGIHNFGWFAGENQDLKDANNVYNFGDSAGFGALARTALNIYNYGALAGYSQYLTNGAQNIYNYGVNAGRGQSVENSYQIYAFGTEALRGSVLTASHDITAIGPKAGFGLTGSFTNLTLLNGDLIRANTVTTNLSGHIFESQKAATNVLSWDGLGRLSLQGKTNLIGDSGTALTYNGVAIGGSDTWGPVGTMVESGITTAGVIPMSTTGGTNNIASPMLGSGTNVAFNGAITAYNGTYSNAIAVGTATLGAVGTLTASGAITSGNQFISTIVAGNPGFKIQNGTGSSVVWNGVGSIKFTADGKMVAYNDGANAIASVQATVPQVTKTANYTILALDSGTRFVNIGAAATNRLDLPTAVAGQHFYFYVDAALNCQVQATGTDVIREGGTVSAAAGDIHSSTVGSTLHLFSPKAGLWVVDQKDGTWVGPQ